MRAALARTHEWFEVNSGWAPPDEETLVDWGLEAIGRAPDDCLVHERGICRHGLVSWQVVLDDLERHDADHVGSPRLVAPKPSGVTDVEGERELPYRPHGTGGLTAT